MNALELLKNAGLQLGVAADRGRVKVRCFDRGWDLDGVWAPGKQEWSLDGEPISEHEARGRLREAGL